VVDTVCLSGQACARWEGCAGSPRTLRHTRGHASRTTARVLAALAGVPLRLVVARGLLALQLREFRVDGAQTPLTGHLLPPPHHVGEPEATGQTPPQPPFYQCIIKAVGFFTVGKPIKPSKTTLPFSERPRKSSRLNDA